MDKQVKFIILILLLLVSLPGAAKDKADYVFVDKSKSALYLLKNGKILKSIPVAFGRNPVGHKQKSGDKKTPEGVYQLDYKNEDSDFYKSIHISYPNEEDIRSARLKGVDPGNQIMIHGQKNGYAKYARLTQRENWTDGCIAVTNEDMDIIWSSIDVPVPIEIIP